MIAKTLTETIGQPFRQWLFRPKTDIGAITLGQRRIFIIPTRQGLGFAAVLLVMLVGSINYSLSLGFALTFLLGSVALLTMVHTFRNMAQLEISAGRAEPVFAGDTARFTFHFRNKGRLSRHSLTLHDNNGHQAVFDLPEQQSLEVQLLIPAARRGWLKPGRLTLFTEFPLGLFHAWSYLHFDTRCLVYPAPASPQALPSGSGSDGSGKLNSAGDEDFSGLRNYVNGDALQRIAWKALAREQGLQVKQFSALQSEELWLDWMQLAILDEERRLEVMTRWVLDADMQGLHYGLRLPGTEIPPDQSVPHRAECLRALALYGLAEPSESP